MRDSFVMHTDNLEDWQALSLEQRGMLITAILAHQTGGELPEMDKETQAVFRPIRRRLERDAAYYAETCEKRSRAGKKGAEKTNATKSAKAENAESEERQKSAKTANAEFADNAKRQKPAKTADYDTDYDTDTDNTLKTKTCAPDDFETFWKSYPKKVGKQDARKAWGKIRPSQDLVKQIMTTLEAAKGSEQWRRDSGRFIPNPATWLNQGRYEDDVSTYPGRERPVTRFHNLDERPDDDIDAYVLEKTKRELGIV